jgi:hypothetical protein
MDSEEGELKKRKIDPDSFLTEDELLHGRQRNRVDAIASNVKWITTYAADLNALSELDAEPGTILEMMRMYIKDNEDKVDEFKRVRDMILEDPKQLKK